MNGDYHYKPARFFAATYAGSWTCWGISAAVAEREGIAFLFNALGLFVPLVVAVVVIYASGNPRLKRDFEDRLVNPRRISPRYLIATLVLPPVLTAIALGLSVSLGQSTEQFELSGPVDQLLPLIILAFVLAPIIEEVGWRGYGMDSLRAKMGVLNAALVFGVLWSLWHAPLVFVAGTYHYELAHMDTLLYLANFFASVVTVSVLVSWLYYRHDRSIVAGILLHSVLNAAAVLPNATQDTKCIVTVLYAVLALVLVSRDRLFAAGPRSFVALSSP